MWWCEGVEGGGIGWGRFGGVRVLRVAAHTNIP